MGRSSSHNKKSKKKKKKRASNNLNDDDVDDDRLKNEEDQDIEIEKELHRTKIDMIQQRQRQKEEQEEPDSSQEVLAEHHGEIDNDVDDDPTTKNKQTTTTDESSNNSSRKNLLSDELLAEELSAAYGDNPEELVILPAKKKTKKSSSAIQLTPQEIKNAQKLQKQSERKLRVLEFRQQQKQKRQYLYQQLADNSIEENTRKLLQKTANLGKVDNKREQLQKLLQKERAGIALSTEEQQTLYSTRTTTTTAAEGEEEDNKETTTTTIDGNSSSYLSNKNKKKNDDDQDLDKEEEEEQSNDDHQTKHNKPPPSSRPNKQATTSTATAAIEDSSTIMMKLDTTTSVHKLSSDRVAQQPKQEERGRSEEKAVPPKPGGAAVVVSASSKGNSPKTVSASSLAAQMMASLTTLKTQQSEEVLSSSMNDEQGASGKRKLKVEEQQAGAEQQQHKKKRYVPSNVVEMKTTQSYEPIPPPPPQQTTSANNNDNNATIQAKLQRPADVEATRQTLPIFQMEFDIMDAIRNHSVVILCAETGSGKSTQIPQFLYEELLQKDDGIGGGGKDGCSRIAVTQPRRVAAVSTAQRVHYEMGFGVLGNNNKTKSSSVVAYQTRYETAGLGNDTRIKFMTDGILLQEIQNDLLLRNYNVIVLDEAHERNLNTDTLIGLLSLALPLRQQAALEEDRGSSSNRIGPLKVIIMSATLRVEDFDNTKLFPHCSKTVVRVPGRTHPVTIHHSKVTEMVEYEEVAFKKTCKIHRQLPPGNILVFLTGKQEIVRMVNRLRRALNDYQKKNKPRDVEQTTTAQQGDDAPRDMDDDEVDGDLFQSNIDDYEDVQDETLQNETSLDPSRGDNNATEKAIVLPLYSLLSNVEQAKVFAPVPEGHRLIVVATNIAETSITIPGITYVVDSGRQKCRNYHAETGIASFDVMWISQAAADQRAGRAGRTGPGHCYRLYSSSLYSRHMDRFALPEVLTRPLEDVVLAMKAMKISNVADFPFPTPPDRSQIDAAAKLLANIGCLDLSKVEKVGGDGEITRLGLVVSKLPLGVRYGKMLLVAAEAGVLDYAIATVAALSESNPFVLGGQAKVEEGESDQEEQEEKDDDKNSKQHEANDKKKVNRWAHKGGDVLAAMLAVGAHAFAGRGAGGASEQLACRKFCENNGLHPVVMGRIQKMRRHLARLAHVRLGNAEGVAAQTGGFLYSMPPPNKLQEQLLCQAIASGLLDNVAMLAPMGSIPGQHPYSLRSAYLGCSSVVKEPIFMDRNSVIFSRDSRRLPKWVCFETLQRKNLKDGTPVAIMKNITPIDPSWLETLAKGSRLLKIGEALPTPIPIYSSTQDAVLCSVRTQFGAHGWEIPSVRMEMYHVLQRNGGVTSKNFLKDDSFRWFARYLLEGKVFAAELQQIPDLLNDPPSLVTRRTPASKVALLVSALANSGVDSASALEQHWSTKNDKFLFGILRKWILPDRADEFKSLWISCVKQRVQKYREGHRV